MQVISLSRAFKHFLIMKHKYDCRFAALENNLQTISNLSTDGKYLLSDLIGDSLSSFMRERSCPLELVRLDMESYKLVARRRFNDIKVEVYEKVD